MENLVLINGLTKRFGDAIAVDNMNLTLTRGEVLGLLGANGAGKTTTMHMMLGLIEQDAGSIEVFGTEFSKNRVACLQRMNFSSTYANLPNNLTVEQNLKVFGLMYNVAGLDNKITKLLEIFEIAHLRKRVSGQLSSGESTRLNLAKAFLNDPELLLLDEPTASLDPDIADRVRTMIRKLQQERGLSILYTSHNMRDIEAVCDRIIFMHHGKLHAEGTPEEMKQRFETESLEDVFIHIARDGEIEEKGGGI